jgi:hypothetical protein
MDSTFTRYLGVLDRICLVYSLSSTCGRFLYDELIGANLWIGGSVW